MKTRILLLLALVLLTMQSYAQSNPPIPIDSSLVYGKLSNGLTYYIRYNEKPKNRADFYFVQQVGSIVEDDSQRGLAHFLEHMAFNGTQTFPGNEMTRFLERNGVEDGENLNAYTGFDETIYFISDLPTTNSEVVDSALIILRDWASGISITDEEVEKERGVIKEEWRTRGGAQFRIWDNLFPQIFPESKYAQRLPIGTIEVIENFETPELRGFFRDWYRPDLQAVIVVGDISEVLVKNRLEELFANVTIPSYVPERIYYPVPDNEEPIVAIATDKEATRIAIDLSFKHDPIDKQLYATELGAIMNYVRQISTSIINERLNDIAQSPTPPFIQAHTTIGNFVAAKTKDAFSITCTSREEGIETAFKALATEAMRIQTFGFTESEYARAKSKLLRFYESAYNERFNQENNTYAQEYTDHFINGGYIPGIAYEYELMKKFASTVTLAAVNSYIDLFIGQRNVVIAITGPEKESIIYPSKRQLLDIFNTVRSEKLTPYKDVVKRTPLLSKKPSKGRIISESIDTFTNSTIFKLSNGATVILKPTDFRTDEIYMKAVASGGFSRLNKQDTITPKVFNSVVELSGLGSFRKTELDKLLSGKKVDLKRELSFKDCILSGSASPHDIETFMQMIYLAFTPISRDQNTFNAYATRTKTQMENQALNPRVVFLDTFTNTLYPDNPYKKRLMVEEVEKVDYTHILRVYKEMFQSGSDFTFIFVGNIDTEVFKKHIATYLAAIPSAKKAVRKEKEIRFAIQEGIIENIFQQPMQMPKATTLNVVSGKFAYSVPNTLKISVFTDILKLLYTEKVREEKGGTYGVLVEGNISKYPKGEAMLFIYFETDPARQSELNSIVLDELDRLATEGIDETMLAAVKENRLKNYAQQIEKNPYWVETLQGYYLDEMDFFSNYTSLVSNLTATDIQQFAKELLMQGNRIKVVMLPEGEVVE